MKETGGGRAPRALERDDETELTLRFRVALLTSRARARLSLRASPCRHAGGIKRLINRSVWIRRKFMTYNFRGMKQRPTPRAAYVTLITNP